MKSKKQKTWNGERNRQLSVLRPCECGCDQRDGYLGVGYITGSDDDGNGVTIWIESEKVFARIKSLVARYRAKRPNGKPCDPAP